MAQNLDLSFIANVGPLFQELDKLGHSMMHSGFFEKIILGSTVTSALGLSVGYIIWMLRSGYLLSSVLATMPAWRLIDPLPVLDGIRDDDEDEDEDHESLESIIEAGYRDEDQPLSSLARCS